MAAGYRSGEDADLAAEEHDWGFLSRLASAQPSNCNGLTLERMRVRPGRCDLPHSHANAIEALYLIKGTVAQVVGEDTIMMTAGDTVVIPAGVTHITHNHGHEEADILMAYSSGVLERDIIGFVSLK